MTTPTPVTEQPVRLVPRPTAASAGTTERWSIEAIEAARRDAAVSKAQPEKEQN